MIMPDLAPALPAVPAEQVGELRAAVRRFIGSRVSDPATADDLTQDVFVKMQKRVGQVRDPQRLMSWLIQIARNTVADFFRGARATEPFKDEHAAQAPADPETFDREETQLHEELSAYIRAVVQSLPPIYREAIVLTDYDGLTQVELSKRLGLSVSAAKSRVQRARALVRETIDRCCHFDVDRYGTVVDCTPNESRCGCGVQRHHAGRAR